MNKYICFLVGFSLLVTACSDFFNDIDTSKNYPAEKVIQFQKFSNDTVIADGDSKIDIIVGLDPKSDLGIDITLKTSLGKFENQSNEITKKINSLKRISASLHSDEEIGTAIITAEVNDIVIDTTILIVKSLPDYLTITPQIAIIDQDSQSITLDLNRYTGNVGQNIDVNISYTAQNTPNAILDIPDHILVDNKSKTITVSNPYKTNDVFTITFQTKNQIGEVISTNTTIEFQIPESGN